MRYARIRSISAVALPPERDSGGSTTTISRAVARPTFRRFAAGRVGPRFVLQASIYVLTFNGEGSDRFGLTAGRSNRAGEMAPLNKRHRERRVHG